jgi:chromosome partitioning protein
MKTLTIASAKGGSGKSTLASALAVRACQDSLKVVMLDQNFDQASLTDWWGLRRRPPGPKPLPHLETAMIGAPLAARLAELAPAFDWAIIDTPPMDMAAIEEAIALAAAVLVPVRCGFFDMVAAQAVSEMCRAHERPSGFVVNCADLRHKTVLAQTTRAIDEALGPRLRTQIKYRQSWIAALATGRTGAEIDSDARAEIDALWVEIRELAKKGSKR